MTGILINHRIITITRMIIWGRYLSIIGQVISHRISWIFLLRLFFLGLSFFFSGYFAGPTVIISVWHSFLSLATMCTGSMSPVTVSFLSFISIDTDSTPAKLHRKWIKPLNLFFFKKKNHKCFNDYLDL